MTQSHCLSDDAYYGILGDFVREVVSPTNEYTEADGTGILACLLVGVGNILGRKLHHRIGRRHAGNLFVTLIGHTTSRKGTCWDVAEEVLRYASDEWTNNCVEPGFGSGQGLVDRVRDKTDLDDGITDKRLLVIEEEFAKFLRLCRTDTSILSDLIRSAYDGKPLTIMNRGENRYGCKEPHISVIGMITAEELLSMTKGKTEIVNGTLNRFLFVACCRTRYFSIGGNYYDLAKQHGQRLRAALDGVKTDLPFRVHAEALDLWDKEYRRLEVGRGGDYGKAVARLSVHCLKLAMIYAALDGSTEIKLPHLKAALAFVNYCDRCAFGVFGKGDFAAQTDEPHTEELPDETPQHVKLYDLIKSRPDGIIKRDAYSFFGNRMKSEDMSALFELLKEYGFIVELDGRWFDRKQCHGVGVVKIISTPCERCEPANCEQDSDELPNDVRTISDCEPANCEQDSNIVQSDVRTISDCEPANCEQDSNIVQSDVRSSQFAVRSSQFANSQEVKNCEQQSDELLNDVRSSQFANPFAEKIISPPHPVTPSDNNLERGLL